MSPGVTGVWRKSSFSGGQGQCVEWAPLAGGAAVRDSKRGEAGPVLSFSGAAFAAFVAAARRGEFDR